MRQFQQRQIKFAEHIRDPDNTAPLQDLEDRRLQIYRELFFNNVQGFLENSFPVLKSLYQCDQWQRLVRSFLVTHHCRSPYFIDISKEFVEYLSNSYHKHPADPVFLEELAHYEWIELAVDTRTHDIEITPWDGAEQVGDVAFSPLAELLSYRYPVHQICPDFQPAVSNGYTYLVVHRQRDNQVRFTEINALSAHLLNVVAQQSIPLDQLVQQMQRDLPQFDAAQLAQGAQQIVQQMLLAEILLPS